MNNIYDLCELMHLILGDEFAEALNERGTNMKVGDYIVKKGDRLILANDMCKVTEKVSGCITIRQPSGIHVDLNTTTAKQFVVVSPEFYSKDSEGDFSTFFKRIKLEKGKIIEFSEMKKGEMVAHEVKEIAEDTKLKEEYEKFVEASDQEIVNLKKVIEDTKESIRLIGKKLNLRDNHVETSEILNAIQNLKERLSDAQETNEEFADAIKTIADTVDFKRNEDYQIYEEFGRELAEKVLDTFVKKKELELKNDAHESSIAKLNEQNKTGVSSIYTLKKIASIIGMPIVDTDLLPKEIEKLVEKSASNFIASHDDLMQKHNKTTSELEKRLEEAEIKLKQKDRVIMALGVTIADLQES